MSIADNRRAGDAVKRITVAVLLALIAGAIWFALKNTSSVSRPEPPPIFVAVLPPPPPPPPTPPKEPPPEPQKMDVPKQLDQPRPDAAPPPLTINGPPQAGADAFGIGAGSGGGMALGGKGDSIGGGTGFTTASYSRFVRAELQQIIQSDDRLAKEVFKADLDIWIDTSGHVNRASIARSTGDSRWDRYLTADLEKAEISEPPPPTIQFPARISVQGRRGA